MYKAYWNELKIILYPFKSLFFWTQGFLNASVIMCVVNQLESLLKCNSFGLGWSRGDCKGLSPSRGVKGVLRAGGGNSSCDTTLRIPRRRGRPGQAAGVPGDLTTGQTHLQSNPKQHVTSSYQSPTQRGGVQDPAGPCNQLLCLSTYLFEREGEREQAMAEPDQRRGCAPRSRPSPG